MSRSQSDALRHMLVEVEFLGLQIAIIDRNRFLGDETLRRAFARSLEVLGEAAKQLTAETRDLEPSVPWRLVTGMRDRLIHGYFAIDYEMVWDAAAHHAPLLEAPLQRMLSQMDDETP